MPVKSNYLHLEKHIKKNRVMKHKTLKELFEKINNDEFIKSIRSNEKDSLFSPTNKTLVGGAVIDILENRKPKDYDFLNFPDSEIERLDLKFIHETKTARTYKGKKGVIVQVLKTSPVDFDFTISQSSFQVKSKQIEKDLKIDLMSFNLKTLIPCEKSWFVKSNALASLYRIPHYKKKGYTIPDITYHSLLSVVKSGIQKQS